MRLLCESCETMLVIVVFTNCKLAHLLYTAMEILNEIGEYNNETSMAFFSIERQMQTNDDCTVYLSTTLTEHSIPNDLRLREGGNPTASLQARKFLSRTTKGRDRAILAKK